MTTTAISAIQTALAQLPGQNFAAAATELLASLGYRSELVPPSQADNVEYFIQTYKASNPGTRSENDFVENTKSVRILFQVADREIAPTQGALFETGGFSAGNVKSFFFVAVELKEAGYSRGSYAAFAREINKRWPIPTVVLFKTSSNLLTLAFMPRRRNHRNESSSVLGSVSLIREIDPANPHRAHLDILAELSLADRLAWMDQHGQQRNFDGLLAAWLDTLDTDKLNKRFYQDLFGWFQRAVDTARVPTNQAKTMTPEEHVIRLITRLLFVWFIKEKGLVAEDLFVENQVRGLLKDYDPATGDSYYRAILQNLFFATLNTEMDRRGFSPGGGNAHPEPSLYRYADQIADLDGLLARFEQTPFINGGLFDCLDSFGDTGDGGYRIDCFSDVHYHLLSIPNRLFFGQDSNSPGLITLFNRYKFTVEENTPAEQEVALDPELLGKVFENLLAAYNPETRETARKQTGSYYTPRPVVDYMVDEALVASLAQKVPPEDGNAQAWEAKLRRLLDYLDYVDSDEGRERQQDFTDAEQAGIVRAIAELKVLDPAVGSGAFPMGVLHKLTLALRRLDPDNTRWEALQKELAGQRATAAFDTANRQERDVELAEISETFERYRNSDFGRKLYLIQNSIYGVDLQPVATQIAKLRFFISLAIDQQPTDDPADNYGIKPLPNLETRFVAADTLLGISEGTQLPLGQANSLTQILHDLSTNRERYFHASQRTVKIECKDMDKELRRQLADELIKVGVPSADAGKIAQWDLFDQNGIAKWFDPRYMFGISAGFDVVIGNPPYVESRHHLLSEDLKNDYQNQVLSDWGTSLPRGSDLLIYFFPRAVKHLCDTGVGCLITQNAWLSTNYGQAFQRFSRGRFSFQKIIDTSARFFTDTNSQNINAVITVFSKNFDDKIEYCIADANMAVTKNRTIVASQTMKWGHLFAMPQVLADILAELSAIAGNGSNTSFGQGLNFPLKDLNQPGADIPVIVKDTQFVADSADGKIVKVNASRNAKIPALIMPRGVGSRYYCTFNSGKAFSYSHVELYLPDYLWESDTHYCLWAYLNSSLAWLFREATGRRNLGGGLLKAEATDMKALPIDFQFDFADDAKETLDILKNREPLPVWEELYTKEHLLIDDMVASHLGFADRQDTIRQSLLEQVNFRLSRSSAKQGSPG